MKQLTLRKKLAASVVAAGVLAGGGTTAALLAGSASASPATPAALTTATATVTNPTSPWCVSALDQLVQNGTITQTQATAVRNAVFQYMQANRPNGPRAMGPGNAWSTVLDQLVKNGTITQAQATAITGVVGPHAGYMYGAGNGWRMGGGPGFGPPWASSSSS